MIMGIKYFLNQFHIWRFHFQLWDTLNDRPSFHYSYQGKNYWISHLDPEWKRVAPLIDEMLGIERKPNPTKASRGHHGDSK